MTSYVRLIETINRYQHTISPSRITKTILYRREAYYVFNLVNI